MFLWVNSEVVELRPNATESDLEAVILAVYRQVLGNFHMMANERLASAEAMLRDGRASVRGFVQMVAKSERYRSLFFDGSSQYRFIELNCKHLLGRAPLNQAEIAAHVQTYASGGYEAEIDSYLESDEYLVNFGENIVPYACGTATQVGSTTAVFNRSFALMRGDATNDVGGQAKLLKTIASNSAAKISKPAGCSGAYDNTGKRFRIAVVSSNTGPRTIRSSVSCDVTFAQLNQKIQSIHKTGGKILSITEVT